MARITASGGSLHALLREFLDHFYTHPAERRQAIASEPLLLEDRLANAYLAAAAEHLALGYRLAVPHWTLEPERFLHAAHFGGPAGMRAILLVESPLAFRRRMIFVDHDPLGRPLRKGRRPQPPAWGPPATNGRALP